MYSLTAFWEPFYIKYEGSYHKIEAFAAAVRTRVAPKTDGVAGRAALELASRVMQSIREHDERVQPVAKRPDAKGPAAKSYPDKASQ